MSKFVFRLVIGLFILSMGVMFASVGLGTTQAQAGAEAQPVAAAPMPTNWAVLGVIGVGAVALLARPRRRMVVENDTRSED
jgi:multisubunit Na+/H+ antiporter MnhC subunit